MTDAALTRLRRADRAMRDPDDIEALLRRGRFGYTATASGDQPFLHPTTFWYDQKARRIYFHGARQGRTLRNVTQNPRVCFGVAEMGRMIPAESACAFSLEYASVSVFGRVRLVEEEAEKRHGLQGLLDKYFPELQPVKDYFPITEAQLSETTVYAIEVETWSGKQKVAPA